MNKAEYLAELRRMLRDLPSTDIDDALDYYDGYLSDAEDEAAAIARLGSPNDVAAQILTNMIKPSDQSGRDGQTKNPTIPSYSTKPAPASSVWNIFKVFLSIVALPFAIAGVALAVSLGVVIFSLGFAGAAALLAGILAIALTPFVFFRQLTYAVTVFGSGLAAVGLGIVLIETAKYLWRTGLYWVLRLLGKKYSMEDDRHGLQQ